jgi:hypothetical protein
MITEVKDVKGGMPIKFRTFSGIKGVLYIFR